MCPDTYDLARGLTLGSHSPPMLVAVAELSGREVFPSLDASASSCVEAALLFLPQQGGMDFLFFFLLLVSDVEGVILDVFEHRV